MAWGVGDHPPRGLADVGEGLEIEERYLKTGTRTGAGAIGARNLGAGIAASFRRGAAGRHPSGKRVCPKRIDAGLNASGLEKYVNWAQARIRMARALFTGLIMYDDMETANRRP